MRVVVIEVRRGGVGHSISVLAFLYNTSSNTLICFVMLEQTLKYACNPSPQWMIVVRASTLTHFLFVVKVSLFIWFLSLAPIN